MYRDERLTFDKKCTVAKLFPGARLGIYTDRDQRSIFGVLNFENRYFFWDIASISCIFLVNAVFLSVSYF